MYECTPYTVRRTVCSVRCVVYSVQCTVYGYTVHCAMYGAHCTLHIIVCIVSILTLQTIVHIVCNIHYIHRIVYSVPCALYTVLSTIKVDQCTM